MQAWEKGKGPPAVPGRGNLLQAYRKKGKGHPAAPWERGEAENLLKALEKGKWSSCSLVMVGEGREPPESLGKKTRGMLQLGGEEAGNLVQAWEKGKGPPAATRGGNLLQA
jgi:hypothetical protein